MPPIPRLAERAYVFDVGVDDVSRSAELHFAEDLAPDCCA